MVPKTPKHDQFLDPKCRKVNLYGKMACTWWGDLFSPSCRGPFNTAVRFPNADGFVVLEKLTPVHSERGGGGKKTTQDPEVQFSSIFGQLSCFWALFLKIQSAISPSILGVRGSSSDSRKLSPIAFNNITLKAQKQKYKKYISSGQTDSRITAGGNLIQYAGDLTTSRTANLMATKMI